MARYIDADKLKIGHTITDIYGNVYGVRDYVTFRDIDDAPTEDVRPVERGKWIEKKAKDGQRYLQCSVCGRNKTDMTYDDFCKFCGADMREVEE